MSGLVLELAVSGVQQIHAQSLLDVQGRDRFENWTQRAN